MGDGRFKFRDAVERIFWTALTVTTADFTIQAITGDAKPLRALALLGVSMAWNFVTIVARWRLSVLPDPGSGVPGLSTGVGDDG